MPRKTVIRIIEGHHKPVETPDGVGENWRIYNAPRPLSGHITWTGPFRHGIFYAAIAPVGDPADEFNDSERMTDSTLRLDGWLIVDVAYARVEEWARNFCKRRELDYDNYGFEDFVNSFLINTEEENLVEYWFNLEDYHVSKRCFAARGTG